MAIEGLLNELRGDYARASRGDKVLAIHLFSIRNADELDGHNTYDFAERAGIGRSYGSEIRKGIRLAQHVRLK